MIDPKLDGIVKTAHSVIDFEKTHQGSRVIIQEGVDTELDELKQRFEELPEFLVRGGSLYF